jgi:tetratricopeptide (TPR) repeat protein
MNRHIIIRRIGVKFVGAFVLSLVWLALLDASSVLAQDTQADLDMARTLLDEADPVLNSYFELKNKKKRDINQAEKKTREAIALLESVYLNEEHRFDACMLLARAYKFGYNLDWPGGFTTSEKYFTEAITIEPENPAPYYKRGILRSNTGPMAGVAAAEDLLRVIKLDPNYAKDFIYGNLAYTYALTMDYEQAVAQCDKQMNINPENYTCKNMLPIWEGFLSTGEKPRYLDMDGNVNLNPFCKAALNTRPVTTQKWQDLAADAYIKGKGVQFDTEGAGEGYPASQINPGQKPTAREILENRGYYSAYFDYIEIKTEIVMVSHGYVKISAFKKKNFEIEKKMISIPDGHVGDIICWGPDINDPEDNGVMMIIGPDEKVAGPQLMVHVGEADAIVRNYYDKQKDKLVKIEITEGPIILHLKSRVNEN